jgi:hypothetical protein
VTVGTLFHRTRVPLQKWFLTIALMAKAEKVPSARRLALIIKVDKKTANYLARRVSEAKMIEFDLLAQITDKVVGVSIGV